MSANGSRGPRKGATSVDYHAQGNHMSRLFESLSIGNLRLENRIVIAPMWQYSATDGSAGAWNMIHLEHFALSGAGLMILKATAVSRDVEVGRILAVCDEPLACLAPGRDLSGRRDVVRGDVVAEDEQRLRCVAAEARLSVHGSKWRPSKIG
jgi:NADH:flavin oxidoreductase / NADH oxidase family